MHVVEAKRRERLQRIGDAREKHGSLSGLDDEILSKPLEKLRGLVSIREISPYNIYESYTRKAIDCHAKTNCLTELISYEPPRTFGGPLAGIPVSIKDNFGIGGYDASMGFAGRCNKPLSEDSPLIKLLRDAGATLFTKTNVPTGMLSILSTSPVWGTTTNPHNTERGPGGSSSGEASLIAGGGSRIGVGTDIGGSVRIPAHFCGIYSIRMSFNRFPRAGIEDASTPGFEGIPDVASPLAKTMKDLRFFVEAVMSMKPWEYCYQLLPIPWLRDNSRLAEAKKPRKVGYMLGDEFLVLTPPVKRALTMTLSRLREQSIELCEFKPPHTIEEIDENYMALILADGLETVTKPMARGDVSDPTIDSIRRYARLPKWLRVLLEWVLKHVFGQAAFAAELKHIGPISTTKYYELIVRREKIRKDFWTAWNASDIDVLITPVFPSPALPAHHFVLDSSCGYSSMFNLLDYPAGVIPVTLVDRELDSLDPDFDKKSLTWESLSYMSEYDAESMHGLPVGVQIVGMRLHDEEVLDAMEYIDGLLNTKDN